MQEGPLPPDIQPPPIKALSRIGDPLARREVQVLPVAIGLVGLHARPTDLRDKQPRDRQGIVTHQFRVEAKRRLPGTFAIVGIDSCQLFGSGRHLLVGLAQHDQADHVLDIPSAVDEFTGQPVEQLRIDRRLALCSQVVEDTTEPGPEELLPHAVHHGSSGERVIARDQPLGEIEPGQFATIGLWPNQERRKSGFHDLARLVHPVAAGQDADGSFLRITDRDDALGQSVVVSVSFTLGLNQILLRGVEVCVYNPAVIGLHSFLLLGVPLSFRLLEQISHQLGDLFQLVVGLRVSSQLGQGDRIGDQCSQPVLLCFVDFLLGERERFLSLGENGVELGESTLLLGCCHEHSVLTLADTQLLDVGEECSQRVEVPHGDRVELVVVAL